MAEVPHSLTGVLGAAQEHGVGALRRAQCQLVEGDALPASRQNAGTSGLGEPQGANCEQHTSNWGSEEASRIVGIRIC